MIRWMGPSADHGPPLSFNKYDTSKPYNKEKWGEGFQAACFFEGPTAFLRKLECHLSILKPGAGYEPHADSHDVVMIIMEGEVETLKQPVEPFGAIFYRGGEPHGMKNRGESDARYLVFEFHGSQIPMTERWPFGLLIGITRKIIPGRIRKRIGRLLGRLGRKFGKN